MNTATPIQPRAAGEAARLQKTARKYFAQEVADVVGSVGTFAAGGYVILFGGKPCGWMRDLSRDRAENGRLTHRPGCVAVAVDGVAAVWDAIGGDYMGGAERWELRA